MRGFILDIEFWGKYALFTKPYTKAHPVSYDVITPSAAKGMLDNIYRHPGINWVPLKIRVCNASTFDDIGRQKVSMVRNETKDVIKEKDIVERGYLNTSTNQIRRRCTYLYDVRYVITAKIEIDDEAAEKGYQIDKVYAIVMDRLKREACKEPPFFGRRECSAHFRLCTDIPECPEGLKGSYSLGKMFYGFDYSDPAMPSLFYEPILTNGVINIPSVETVKNLEYNAQ